VAGALDEHTAGAAGRVADAHGRLGVEEAHDQLDDLLGGVELAALLAGVVGEALDEVFVGAAEQVGLGEVLVAEADQGEVGDEAGEQAVALLAVALSTWPRLGRTSPLAPSGERGRRVRGCPRLSVPVRDWPAAQARRGVRGVIV
jgi:hypothetical protein